jgi:hypothetical protein
VGYLNERQKNQNNFRHEAHEDCEERKIKTGFMNFSFGTSYSLNYLLLLVEILKLIGSAVMMFLTIF